MKSGPSKEPCGAPNLTFLKFKVFYLLLCTVFCFADMDLGDQTGDLLSHMKNIFDLITRDLMCRKLF